MRDANHEEPIKVVKTKKSLKLLLSLNLRNGCLLLGWEPTIFKYVKGKTYNDPVRKVPQISDKDGKICRDIKDCT
jgi:hypothetical protein